MRSISLIYNVKTGGIVLPLPKDNFKISNFTVMEFNEAIPKYYPKMSPTDFLAWEREQEYKHEYVGGEVFAMTGASVNLNRIASNIIGRTWNHIQGKDCNIVI